MKKIPKEFLLALYIFIPTLILTFITSFVLGPEIHSFYNLYTVFPALFLTLSILAGPLSYLILLLLGQGGSLMLSIWCVTAFIGAKGILNFWDRKNISTWLRVLGITLWVSGGMSFMALVIIWYGSI